jgi:cytochrome c oxidase assembly protein subunit 15
MALAVSEPKGRWEMTGLTLSQRTSAPSVWLHRFALAVAVMTVVLISAGALVTSTQSGDAIPDWPTSYGALVPSYLAGGVLIEWMHRLVAGVTALLITALAIWLAFSPVPRWLKGLGGAAFLAVLAQAVLGGLRVLVVSHPQVQATALQVTGAPHSEAARIAFAIAHATLAQIVLSLAFAIALFTSPSVRKGHGTRDTGQDVGLVRPVWQFHRLSAIASLLIALLFAQLLLGAVMRHTGAGLIIPDFPTSFGKLFPPFGDLPFDPNNPERMTYSEFAFKVAVHFAHRFNALLIALTIGALFWQVRRRFAGFTSLRRLTAWLLGLVLVQISLGALSIWTQLSVPVTVIHVAVGATLLGLSVLTLCHAILRAGERP